MLQRTFFPPMLFNRVKVCGRYIPSLASIDLILNEINDETDRLNFVESNNEFVEIIQSIYSPEGDAGYISLELLILIYQELLAFQELSTLCKLLSIIIQDLLTYRELLAYRELFVELYQNYQRQHEAIGCNEFNLFWQSLAVVEWFAAMAAKMKEGNIQDLERKAKEICDRFKNFTPIIFESANENHVPRYSDLKERFPEYAKAIENCDEWNKKTVILRGRNYKLDKLTIYEKWLLVQICKKIESSENKHLNICCFCKKLFPSDRGGGHKSCGSTECEQRYSAATTKKNRSQPHSINEKERRSSQKGVTQWSKADNTPRWCVGVCSKRRLVNKHRICEQCHGGGFHE